MEEDDDTIREIQEERQRRLGALHALTVNNPFFLVPRHTDRPNVTHTTDPERRRILDGIMEMFRPRLVNMALRMGANPFPYLAPEAQGILEQYEHNLNHHHGQPGGDTIHHVRVPEEYETIDLTGEDSSDEEQEEGRVPEEYETIDLTGEDY